MRVAMAAFVLAMGMPLVLRGAVPGNAPDTEVGARATLVDTRAKELLGLSIKDLALLLDAAPNHFRPLLSEQRFGTLVTARKLEATGYITIKTTMGLPSGSNATEEFLTYLPTAKGQQVIDALAH